MRKAFLVIAMCALATVAGARDTMSSGRDYSDNAQRDRPIACKPGDIQKYPGQSLGDVFGADWPAQPEPSSPDTRSAARPVAFGPMHWPRGLDPQHSFTVVAVLVAADGKPLRAEVLCSTRMGFDKAVRRHAMASTYAAAQVDGQPITSPLVRVVRFVPGESKTMRTPRP